ncbi:MAG: hypothetical protein ABSG01_15255 [Anaerolineales bacterium]|jgi:hypothetical protein
MTDSVECYSGSTYGERPMALTWQGKRYTILEILFQGRTPMVKWFRVRTEAGDLFELSFNEAAGESPLEHEWQILKL